jgi:periplasmic protein TonB
MEPKKNPKYDVHRKRGMIFNFSLALSLFIVITAFRITVPLKDRPVLEPTQEEDLLFTAVLPTEHDKPRPPENPLHKPIAAAAPIDRIKVVDELSKEADSRTVDIETTSEPADPFINVTAPPEDADADTDFIIVENPPLPVGGYEGFYKTIRDNITYPKRAQRLGTTGKVFVQFVVDKNGEPVNMTVLTGIGNGCDEEAMRVIGLTRWQPGKQRGKPVRVKMVLPVAFTMQPR